MAKIISMSLNKPILRDLDRLETEMGFSGRSEAIRAGIRALLSEQRERSKMKGTIDAISLIVHADKDSEEIMLILHRHRGLIRTQIHNHLDSHKCFEVLVLHGDSARIRQLAQDFESSKKVDMVKLIAL